MRIGPSIVIVGALLAAACSSETDDSPQATPTATEAAEASAAPTAPITEPPFTGYVATITRTEYGIPHIVADDWGSLGFGQGYAFAEDRACTLLDQVIKVRGERAKWFGAGVDDANINSDFAYRHLRLHADAATRWGDQQPSVAAMIEGYVVGFNTSLADNGPRGWCAGQPWVQPITTDDLYAFLTDTMIIASSGALVEQIATATPPEPTPIDTTPADTAPTDTAPGDTVPDDSTVTTASAAWSDLTPQLASNGWALGSAATENGGGMLLANPHFPWEGEKRLWESHLTLTTGEYDVYGVTLSGVPGVLIGFNKDVAWTHTVSAGKRMTLYELDLTPGDPTSYRYGLDPATAETRSMTATEVTIEVLGDDGATAEQSRTMWSSHYGPMLNLPFGWSDTKAYTLRDANIDNADGIDQFLAMGSATSMDEFIAAHRDHNGIPWVNTIATSADGQAWYADTAAAPNLSPEAIAGWQAGVLSGGTAALTLDQGGAILLNGSDPANEWVDDPAATRPGILPFDQQPQLLRNDYVFNANDSHWLANPDELLVGFQPTTGPEGVPQTARTRMNALLLADPQVRGEDGLMSLGELQGAFWSNRGLHSELLLKGIIAACDDVNFVLVDDVPYDITEACNVLRGWDGTYQADARGAVLFREYLAGTSRLDRTNAGSLYSTPFDPADPVGTPNTPVTADRTLLATLGTAAKDMERDGYPLDITLGEMQFDGRAGAPTGDERIPLGGGTNLDGTISIIDCCSGANTTAPSAVPGTVVERRYYDSIGYPVSFGNSFVMTLTFGPDGPEAQALLTYGQPDDPSDPGFTEQMQLYSQQQFRDIRFTADEVAAAGTETVEVRGERP